MAILYAFLILAALGLLLGLGLAIAEKKLSVETDPVLEQLVASMPGANCGGCGFAGCSAYAEAVFKGEAEAGLCSPGGAALAAKMGQILGVEVQAKERLSAYVFCKGNCEKTVKVYDYKGLADCNAAASLYGGDNGCKAGCLHLGSCINACPVQAISKNADKEIVVDREKCIGCGKCTKVCPNGVIKLIPYSATHVVSCNSHENGAAVRKVCQVGCIGCKICQTKFPESGFTVDAFLASSDYKAPAEKADEAMNACPRKIINRI